MVQMILKLKEKNARKQEYIFKDNKESCGYLETNDFFVATFLWIRAQFMRFMMHYSDLAHN